MKKIITYALMIGIFLNIFPVDKVFASSFDFNGEQWLYSQGNKTDYITHKFKMNGVESEIRYKYAPGEPTYTVDERGWGPTGNYDIDGIDYKGKNFVTFYNFGGNAELGSPLHRLIVLKEGSTYKIINLLYSAVRTVKESCQRMEVKGQTQKEVGQGITASGTGYGNCMYDPNDFIEQASTDYRDYITKVRTRLRNNPVVPKTTNSSINITPDAAAITKCSINTIYVSGPMTATHADKIQSTIYDPIIAKADVGAQDTVRELINNNKITASEDKTLYELFYKVGSDANKKYPDQYLDEGYRSDFLDIYQDTESTRIWADMWNDMYNENPAAQPGENVAGAGAKLVGITAGGTAIGAGVLAAGASGVTAIASAGAAATSIPWLSTALTAIGCGSINAGSALAAVALAPLTIILIVGAIAILGALAWKNAMKKADYGRYIHSLMRLFFAYSYIAANVAYQKCSGTLTKYPEQQSVYENISFLQKDADASATGTIGEIPGKNVCDEITKGGLIGKYIYQAFCNLGLMLEAWADSILKNAFCYLKLSIGYTDPATTESKDWSSCNITATSTTNSSSTDNNNSTPK